MKKGLGYHICLLTLASSAMEFTQRSLQALKNRFGTNGNCSPLFRSSDRFDILPDLFDTTAEAFGLRGHLVGPPFFYRLSRESHEHEHQSNDAF